MEPPAAHCGKRVALFPSTPGLAPLFPTGNEMVQFAHLAQNQPAGSPLCWVSRTNMFNSVPGNARASAGWDRPRRWQPNFGTTPPDHPGGPGPSQALGGTRFGTAPPDQPRPALTHRRRRRRPNYYSRRLMNIHEGGRRSPPPAHVT